MHYDICIICENQFSTNNKTKRLYCSYVCAEKIRNNKLNNIDYDLIEEKYWNNIEKKEKCWYWKGRIHRQYGVMYFFGKCIGAHRISWIIHNGSIPDGMQILHKCDNPPCTNPDHLFLGTHQDNMKDMKDKKRGMYGGKRMK